RTVTGVQTCALPICRLLVDGPVPAEAPADEAQSVTPPKGFTALFNGKDLTGWHGWAIHEKAAGPYDLAKLSPEERARKIEQWSEIGRASWRERGERA